VIAQLKLMIAKMRHERFGASSERGRMLLEQLERGIAIGRKARLFAGSDRGGERAAAIYTLIVTAKLNGLDPRAWLADVLRRIADYPAARLDELLPWNCTERAAKLAV
jgi:transposase